MLRNLFKKKSLINSQTHYASIYDMPIYNWFKMRSESDYSYLFKSKLKHKTELTDEENKYFNDIYLNMLTEFFNEFGQKQSFKNENKLKLQIIELNLEYAISGDTFLLNSIAVLREKLKIKQSNNIDSNMGISEDMEMKRKVAKVSESLRTAIDPRTFTVVKFYTQLSICDISLN